MAKRKKRKGAGPPPVTGPKRPSAVAAAEQAAAKPQAQPKRRPGEPVPPSFRGVLLRAAIIAALFYPYLIYVAGSSPAAAFLISLVGLALMIPLGLFLDRFRYRRQVRRWEERRAARTPGR